MTEKTKLTKEGYDKLQAEYRQLIDVKRPEVLAQLSEARAQGDLSENADYDAARAKQSEVENRIKEIEHILDNCEIVDSSKNKNKVSLGSKVTIKYVEADKTMTYTIVSSIESDPFNGKISNVCPLGEAIVGKIIGDTVEVKGAKSYHVEILNTEN